jgi:tetratricopeptide (TPR) repeat protein
MMKKLIMIAIAIMTVATVYSQKRKVNAAQAYIDNEDLEAAEKRMEDVFDHKRSKDWPKTYLVAAKLAAAKYQEEKDVDLLQKAVDHYMKAIELDKADRGRFENEIKIALTFFVNELTQAGIGGFNEQNYEKAMMAFENVLKVNELEMFQQDSPAVDTAIIYNTGLAAYNAQTWDKAAEYLEKSIKYNYGGGDAVLLLHQVYGTMQDSIKMVKNLQTGFEKYPEDDRLLTQLINYYLETKQNDQAMEYLNRAVASEPKNPTYYYARGVLYDQGQKYDEAIEDYKKALELDNNYFDALFNLGVIYYNEAIEQMNVANAETDHKKFNAEKEKADSLFKSSLPYMKRAHEVKPKEPQVLESLKGLYYRFEMNDKYEEVVEKLKEFKGSSADTIPVPGE